MQNRGANQLRKARTSECNRIYHVTTVTFGRRRLFSDLQSARLVVRALRREQEAGSVESLCFVVMPDHLHWMFALGAGETLSRVVQRVKGGSARMINRYKKRSGPIWAPNFYDRAIRYDEDVTAVARYIVANPVRAGLVANVGDYPHWDAVWLDVI